MIIGINGEIGHGKDTLGLILQALTMEQQGRWYHEPIEYAKGYEGKPNLKGGWRIVKFADKLKECASLMTGIPREDFEKPEVKKSYLSSDWDYWTPKEYPRLRFHTLQIAEANGYKTTELVRTPTTVRQFMLDLGDGTRGQIHTNCWINALFADYKHKDPPYLSRNLNDTQIPYIDWIVTDVRMPNEFSAIRERGGINVRITRPDAPESGISHATESALKGFKFDLEITNVTLNGLVESARDVLKLVQ